MKNKKIILAGGSGFIGEELIKFFCDDNEVIVLTRQLNNSENNRHRHTVLSSNQIKNIRWVKWDGIHAGDWTNEFENADLVINLAGKTVNCRYTEKNKKEILDSRVLTTRLIGQVIRDCKNPPVLWINSSSATIYPESFQQPNDEYITGFKNDFSVEVCKAWEKTVYEFDLPQTRKVILRMAITLGAGGILKPYFNLLKFGLGGTQGSGRQFFSWVHVADTCRIIDWIARHEDMAGVFNCCAPNPVTNREFMLLLRQATGIKFGLPAFEWMLKIGALVIGTETELILKSRNVISTRLNEAGFKFKFPEINDAFRDIIKQTPRKEYSLF